MYLSHLARELYELQITTTATDGDPIPAADWEASFDRGQTFVQATVLTHDNVDWSSWLLAGADADEGDAVAVIRASIRPLIRAIDTPEVIIRTAPEVTLI